MEKYALEFHAVWRLYLGLPFGIPDQAGEYKMCLGEQVRLQLDMEVYFGLMHLYLKFQVNQRTLSLQRSYHKQWLIIF